jgi:hypothetical protein
VRKSPLLATWVSAHIMACLAPELWSTTTTTRFRAASSVLQNPPPRRCPRALPFFLDQRRDPRLLPVPQSHSRCSSWCGALPLSLELSCPRKCSQLPPLLPIDPLPLPRLGACALCGGVESWAWVWCACARDVTVLSCFIFGGSQTCTAQVRIYARLK